MNFLRILGLTVLGVIGFLMIALFGTWFLFMTWPIIIIALPIAALIYLIELIKISKQKKQKGVQK